MRHTQHRDTLNRKIQDSSGDVTDSRLMVQLQIRLKIHKDAFKRRYYQICYKKMRLSHE